MGFFGMASPWADEEGSDVDHILDQHILGRRELCLSHSECGLSFVTVLCLPGGEATAGGLVYMKSC